MFGTSVEDPELWNMFILLSLALDAEGTWKQIIPRLCRCQTGWRLSRQCKRQRLM